MQHLSTYTSRREAVRVGSRATVAFRAVSTAERPNRLGAGLMHRAATIVGRALANIFAHQPIGNGVQPRTIPAACVRLGIQLERLEACKACGRTIIVVSLRPFTGTRRLGVPRGDELWTRDQRTRPTSKGTVTLTGVLPLGNVPVVALKWTDGASATIAWIVNVAVGVWDDQTRGTRVTYTRSTCKGTVDTTHMLPCGDESSGTRIHTDISDNTRAYIARVLNCEPSCARLDATRQCSSPKAICATVKPLCKVVRIDPKALVACGDTAVSTEACVASTCGCGMSVESDDV
jgi:hypothetical protein